MDSAVSAWLEDLGLRRYVAVFAENEIGLEALRLLNEQDLRELGLPLGPRKLLLNAIAELKAGAAASEPALAPSHPAPTGAPNDAGERRQLTVMFCDLVESTALSARLDSEALRTIIRAYQDMVVKIIQQFEGHIAQYLGDGLLVYFGHPFAHEDDVERALHAGLGIVAAMRDLNLQLNREAAAQLKVRIGIHTGVVVVGEMGRGERQEQLALGETPNLAARLQTLAEPDSVVISEHTRRLASGSFAYADLGQHAFKGISQPLHLWRVAGLSEAASRFEAATQTGLTPLVGREHEIALLLERWALAQDGEGQVVLLSGEPGIGKSRILNTLRERLQRDVQEIFRLQCSPYYVNSAFYPSIASFERTLRFDRESSTDAKLDRLEALLVEQQPATAGGCAFHRTDPVPPLRIALRTVGLDAAASEGRNDPRAGRSGGSSSAAATHRNAV